MPGRTKQPPRRRITLDVADGLLSTLDATASAVRESRSGFILTAIETRVRSLKRAQIDAAFEEMANDPAYQAALRDAERAMGPASDASWRLIDASERVPAARPSAVPSRRRSRAAR